MLLSYTLVSSHEEAGIAEYTARMVLLSTRDRGYYYAMTVYFGRSPGP